VLGAEPDGRNINRGVGSTHPDKLAETVKQADTGWVSHSTATVIVPFSSTETAG
jgi:hypothetical protein